MAAQDLELWLLIAGVELARVDASTAKAGFARQLRWDQAYYRLAQGLARG